MIALTLLTRPVIGVVWAAALIGFGVGVAYRGARGSLPRNVTLTQGGDGKYRLLVVANETVGGEPLLDEIRDRCGVARARFWLSRQRLLPRGRRTGLPMSTKRSSWPGNAWSCH